MLAEGDSCDPRPTSVEIPLNASDIRAFYYPTCTKINRCGGCCGSDALECVATQVVRTNVKASVDVDLMHVWYFRAYYFSPWLQSVISCVTTGGLSLHGQ